jgi:FeS assembly SUF system protein
LNLLNIFRKNDSEEKSDTKIKPIVDGLHNIAAPEEPQAPLHPKTKPETPIDTEAVKEEIIKALKTVYDPEIPVDIYELGLIYDIRVEPDGNTSIQMTLTAPNCPAAGILPGQVESKARGVEGVFDVKLDLTFDPPWSMDKMSESARLELGML